MFSPSLKICIISLFQFPLLVHRRKKWTREQKSARQLASQTDKCYCQKTARSRTLTVWYVDVWLAAWTVKGEEPVHQFITQKDVTGQKTLPSAGRCLSANSVERLLDPYLTNATPPVYILSEFFGKNFLWFSSSTSPGLIKWPVSIWHESSSSSSLAATQWLSLCSTLCSCWSYLCKTQEK